MIQQSVIISKLLDQALDTILISDSDRVPTEESTIQFCFLLALGSHTEALSAMPLATSGLDSVAIALSAQPRQNLAFAWQERGLGAKGSAADLGVITGCLTETPR